MQYTGLTFCLTTVITVYEIGLLYFALIFSGATGYFIQLATHGLGANCKRIETKLAVIE